MLLHQVIIASKNDKMKFIVRYIDSNFIFQILKISTPKTQNIYKVINMHVHELIYINVLYIYSS